MILPPQPLQCWDYKNATPCPAYISFLKASVLAMKIFKEKFL
jgi:hypothetical protein